MRNSVAKRGRPSSFRQEIAEEICARIAQGESLVSVCRSAGLPSYATITRWLAEREDFRLKYAQAREDQADFLADQIVEIADEAIPELPTGGLDSAAVAQQRLRVEARKWTASKLKPKKYSDSQRVEHSGSITLGLADKLASARRRVVDAQAEALPAVTADSADAAGGE